MERFEELKKIILERAHNSSACKEQYSRAYKAENLEKLMQVIRDNFWWACYNHVLDGDIIDSYRDEFAAGKIWHNENVTEGFLIASDSASVKASGSASVKAYDSASVEAYDSASVEAYGSASVEASGSAYVCSYTVKECQISDHALYRIMESNTIRYADPDMKFEKVE